MLRERATGRQGELALRRPRAARPRAGRLRSAPSCTSPLPEADRRRDLGRRRPVLPRRGVPRGEQSRSQPRGSAPTDGLELLEAAQPAVGHFGPLLLALPLVGLDRLVVLPASACERRRSRFPSRRSAADTWPPPRPAPGRAGRPWPPAAAGRFRRPAWSSCCLRKRDVRRAAAAKRSSAFLISASYRAAMAA